MDFAYVPTGGITLQTEPYYGSITLDTPQTSVNDYSFFGVSSWSSPETVFTPGLGFDNSQFAMTKISNPVVRTYYTEEQDPLFSNFLKITNFNLSAITNASFKITEITGAKVYCQVNGLGVFSQNVNVSVHLVKNNTIVDSGLIKRNMPISLQYVHFGDSNEQWGTSITPQDIDSGFGIAIAASYGDNINSGDKLYKIVYVKIILYFNAIKATSAFLENSSWSYTASGGLSLDGDTVMWQNPQFYIPTGGIKILPGGAYFGF